MTTTTTMKIELKKVEYSARMSEETLCFVAEIHADGKYIGYAENRGTGGSTSVHILPKNSPLTRDEATAAILEHGEAIGKSEWDKGTVDRVVDRMLTIHLTRKDAAKLLKNQLCFLNAEGKIQATKKQTAATLTMLHALPEEKLFGMVRWAKGLRLLKTVDEIAAALDAAASE